MSTENNTMKIDDEKIKEVLRHHQDLTRQIHEQVIDIRKKIDEVKQQCLEIAFSSGQKRRKILNKLLQNGSNKKKQIRKLLIQVPGKNHRIFRLNGMKKDRKISR